MTSSTADGGENALDLGGKDEFAVFYSVKEWLDAYSVASKEESAPFFVPNRKGKNAVEFVHTFRAEYGKCVQHHLGVGMSVEAAAFRNEFVTDFGGVVKLAVVDNYIPVSVVQAAHGLSAVFNIHHAKPGMYQYRAVAQIQSFLIGTAPSEHVLHLVRLISGNAAARQYFSCN